ncbi:HlyD family type I secretion periplasmic adaptor subunit, partial [Mesorhizobium sp. M4B.F.Ca.ET.169.01.1.1]
MNGIGQQSRTALLAATGGLLLISIGALLRQRSPVYRASRRNLKQRTRPARMLGYASAILFVGGTAAWSSVALLASAVVANGVVSPEGYRKTVQHLEGGII